MSARRFAALAVMVPISALVCAAYLAESVGLFELAERIDAWTSPRIVALQHWVARGEL